MATPDEVLVRRALAGSEEAYRELVRRYERPLLSLVLRMVRDRATAEDLVQDVFVKAFQNLASFDPGRKFSSWLFKIAHNATLDALRRRRLVTVPLESSDPDRPDLLDVVPADGTDTPLARLERADLARALEEVVAELREEYREVILLRHQEGLAYEAIAEVTGMPLGTVKTFLHRARKEMARALARRGWGPDGPDDAL